MALGSKADFWLVSEGYIPDIEFGTALKMKLVLHHCPYQANIGMTLITSPHISYQLVLDL